MVFKVRVIRIGSIFIDYNFNASLGQNVILISNVTVFDDCFIFREVFILHDACQKADSFIIKVLREEALLNQRHNLIQLFLCFLLAIELRKV